MTLRPSGERGHAFHGWLDSHHTFSFAGYYDPAHMGFGDLRVINEDRVEPGRGFGTHGHRDMEIISYVVDGALEHRDSMGSGGVLRHGDVQVMSAGTGVRHSEMNGSATEPVHFLQIWVMPAEQGTTPAYADKHFAPAPGWTLLVSPDAREGSLRVGQDIDLWRGMFDAAQTVTRPLRRGRAWVQVVRGAVALGDTTLRAGDGAAIEAADELTLHATDTSELLVFDLR